MRKNEESRREEEEKDENEWGDEETVKREEEKLKRKKKEKEMECVGERYCVHNNDRISCEENANNTVQRSKKIV